MDAKCFELLLRCTNPPVNLALKGPSTGLTSLALNVDNIQISHGKYGNVLFGQFLGERENVTQGRLAQEGSGDLVLFFWPSFISITNIFPVQIDSFKIAISNLS